MNSLCISLSVCECACVCVVERRGLCWSFAYYMYGAKRFLELVSVSKVSDDNDIIVIIILEPGSIHCLGQNSIIFELPEVVDKFCVVIKKWNEKQRQ